MIGLPRMDQSPGSAGLGVRSDPQSVVGPVPGRVVFYWRVYDVLAGGALDDPPRKEVGISYQFVTR